MTFARAARRDSLVVDPRARAQALASVYALLMMLAVPTLVLLASLLGG